MSKFLCKIIHFPCNKLNQSSVTNLTNVVIIITLVLKERSITQQQQQQSYQKIE